VRNVKWIREYAEKKPKAMAKIQAMVGAIAEHAVKERAAAIAEEARAAAAQKDSEVSVGESAGPTGEPTEGSSDKPPAEPKDEFEPWAREWLREDTKLYEEVKSMLGEFMEDVFPAGGPTGVVPGRGDVCYIPLKGEPPRARGIRRYSESEKAEIFAQITDFIARGWIRPSASPCAAPILFAKKKDGKMRMVVDYRRLNDVVGRVAYPMPRAEDMFDRIGGAKYMSSMDLKSGYHQFEVAEEDRWKTAFATPDGLYEYNVMPMGLTTAPATFQRAMNRLFAGMPFVQVYIDDIAIFSETKEEHMQHLRAVLEKLQGEKLCASLPKCVFFAKEMEFLGHIVSQDGLKPDPKKVDAVINWPRPRTITDVKQYVGFINYYLRFNDRQASVLLPLTEAMKGAKTRADGNVQVEWTPAMEESFERSKVMMASAPVLKIAEPGKPFVIFSDASDFATGAVLMQDNGSGELQPIAFLSKKLDSAQRNYSMYEKEGVAIILALEQWRCYFEGSPVLVYTDHLSLMHLKSQEQLNRRQARWLHVLERGDVSIIYKRGEENLSDALSRRPDYFDNARSEQARDVDALSDEAREAMRKTREFLDEVAARRLERDDRPSLFGIQAGRQWRLEKQRRGVMASWEDRDDYMLNQETFQSIDKVHGPFDVDAAADDEGKNSQVDMLW
jgi:hypothetical protein